MLFCSINVENFDHIFEPVDNLRYTAKAQIYTQGEQGREIYSIRNGLVKLVQFEPNGNQRIVRLLGAKDVFGLESLLSEPYHQTAIVLQELSICRIPISSLTQLEDATPSLNDHVMQCWGHHLSRSEQWLTQLSVGSVKTRVINFLLMLKAINRHHNETLKLISYEDIASIICSSRETVTRIMVELKVSGLIHKGETAKEIYFDDDVLKNAIK